MNICKHECSASDRLIFNFLERQLSHLPFANRKVVLNTWPNSPSIDQFEMHFIYLLDKLSIEA